MLLFSNDSYPCSKASEMKTGIAIVAHHFKARFRMWKTDGKTVTHALATSAPGV